MKHRIRTRVIVLLVVLLGVAGVAGCAGSNGMVSGSAMGGDRQERVGGGY